MNRHSDGNAEEQKRQPKSGNENEGGNAYTRPEKSKGDDFVTKRDSAFLAIISNVNAEESVVHQPLIESLRAAHPATRRKQEPDRRWKYRYEDSDNPNPDENKSQNAE